MLRRSADQLGTGDIGDENAFAFAKVGTVFELHRPDAVTNLDAAASVAGGVEQFIDLADMGFPSFVE